ncbi:MAG: DUF5979 domain-containing protein [Actinomycetaceae bacterium]|nr:DUF5979 domain-containing protein [Actinomycetaceae bacterium]
MVVTLFHAVTLDASANSAPSTPAKSPRGGNTPAPASILTNRNTATRVPQPAVFRARASATATAEERSSENPIIGSSEDPWPADPDRPNVSQNAGSVALVFEFGTKYNYQTMGGLVPGTKGSKAADCKHYNGLPKNKVLNSEGYCRNWDANAAMVSVIDRLKGTPLRVGVYQYSKKKEEQSSNNNTPSLGPTSLTDPAGFQKVVDKLWSLDASNDGKGLHTTFGGNTEWGLGVLYRDMYLYKEKQRQEYLADNPDDTGLKHFKPRPLYSKIILMTVADPHWHLHPITDWKQDKWVSDHDVEGTFVDRGEDSETWHYYGWNSSDLYKNPGRAGALSVAKMLREMGADIRAMGMNDWVHYGNSYRKKWLQALTGEPQPQDSTNSNVQVLALPNAGDSNPGSYWSKNGTYNRGTGETQMGFFANTIERWLLEDTHLSITSDLVDQDYRYVKPNARHRITLSPTSSAPLPPISYRTGEDGRMTARLKDLGLTDGVKVQFPSKTGAFLHTRFKNKVARCVGYKRSVGSYHYDPDKIKEAFWPSEVTTGPDGSAAFTISREQILTYGSIKCSLYSRPLQETQIEKHVEISDDSEVIRPYVAHSKFKLIYSCKDPLDGNKVLVPDTTTKPMEVLRIENEVSFPAIDLGKLPVGAQCSIKEDITNPKLQTLNGGEYDVDGVLWDRLMTRTTTFNGQNWSAKTTDNPTDTFTRAATQSTTGVVTLPPITAPAGQISSLRSSTTFAAKRGEIYVDARFAKAKVPDGKSPNWNDYDENLTKPGTVVPVFYNCRYMPDPTHPPEKLGFDLIGGLPPAIGSGTVSAVVGKKVRLGTWPVGTHCAITSNTPINDANFEADKTFKPFSIPGFELHDEFTTDMCASTHWQKPPASGDYSVCNPYIWLNNTDKRTIVLTQIVSRQSGTVIVDKTLVGDAAKAGANKPIPMRLTCDSLFSQEAKVVPGVPYSFTGVPAQTKCELTETGNPEGLDAGIVVSRPATQQVGPIMDTATDTRVSSVTTLTFKRAPVKFTHETVKSNYTGDLEEVKKLSKTVTAICTEPGNISPITITKTFTGDIGEAHAIILKNDKGLDFAVGTRCKLSTLVDGAAKISKTLIVSTPDVEVVVPESGTTAAITTTAATAAAGSITINMHNQTSLTRKVLRDLIPGKYTLKMRCGTGDEANWIDYSDQLKFYTAGATKPTNERQIIADGGEAKLENTDLPANSQCKVTIKVGNIAELDRTTNFFSDGTNDTDGNQSSDAVNPTFTFSAPGADGARQLTINNAYEVATTQFKLTTAANLFILEKAKANVGAAEFAAGNNPTITSQKLLGERVPAAYRKAFFAGNTAKSEVSATLGCAYKGGKGEGATVKFTVPIRRGPTPLESDTIELPVGWDCKLAVDAADLQIPGSELSGVQFTGGTFATQRDVTVNSQLPLEYRLKLASFNLKKKVGGEGVSRIPPQWQFPINISCTLNGKAIPVPQPRTPLPWTKKADANPPLADPDSEPAKQYIDAVNAPWEMVDNLTVNTLRFEQGEEHPIDRLPAGASCTLAENYDRATDEGASLNHYWEINDGYRARGGEKLLSSCRDSDRYCSRPYLGKIPAGASPAERFKEAAIAIHLPTDKPMTKSLWKETDNKAGQPNATVPQYLPENFFGTAVTWNNYEYQKTAVKVSLKASGTANGERFAEGQSFKARLYCKPPKLTSNDGSNLEEIQKLNAAAVLTGSIDFTVKNGAAEGESNIAIPTDYSCVIAPASFSHGDASPVYALEAVIDPAKGDIPVAVEGNFVTAGIFTQDEVIRNEDPKRLPWYDTSLQKRTDASAPEDAIFAFKVPGAYTKVKDRITQKYDALLNFKLNLQLDRPQARVLIKQNISKADGGSASKNVGDVLGIKTYPVHYECADHYLMVPDPKTPTGDVNASRVPLTYSGDLTVAKDTTEPGVLLPNLPESVTCKFTQKAPLGAGGADPFAPWNKAILTGWNEAIVKVKTGDIWDETRAYPTSGLDPSKLDVSDVQLNRGDTLSEGDAKFKRTTLTFTNTYSVPLSSYEVGNYVNGKRAAEAFILGSDTTFTYTCKLPSGLPGFDNWVTSGKVKAEEGQITQMSAMPKGSTCTITGKLPERKNATKVVKVKSSRITLDLSMFGSAPRARAAGGPDNGLGRPDFTNAKLLTSREGIAAGAPLTLEVSDTNPMRAFLHEVWSNAAKMRIQKVNADGNVVPNATFSVYEKIVPGGGDTPTNYRKVTDPGFALTAESGIHGSFLGELPPGSYYLAVENAGTTGTERFPFGWKFTVSAADANNTNDNQDTVVEVTDEAKHSGLIALYNPQGQNLSGGTDNIVANEGSIWTIRVADITTGVLPSSGGYLPWVLLIGLILISAAGISMWQASRRL